MSEGTCEVKLRRIERLKELGWRRGRIHSSKCDLVDWANPSRTVFLYECSLGDIPDAEFEAILSGRYQIHEPWGTGLTVSTELTVMHGTRRSTRVLWSVVLPMIFALVTIYKNRWNAGFIADFLVFLVLSAVAIIVGEMKWDDDFAAPPRVNSCPGLNTNDKTELNNPRGGVCNLGKTKNESN